MNYLKTITLTQQNALKAVYNKKVFVYFEQAKCQSRKKNPKHQRHMSMRNENF